MWSPVAGAYSYTVQYSQDPTFSTGSQTGIVNAPLTTYTVPGREPDTIYFVRVKTYPNLPGDDTASNYSAAQSVRTLSSSNEGSPGGDGTVVGSLQNWLAEEKILFQHVAPFLPQLGDFTISSPARRRLQGSGTKRYGFIDKVSDTSAEYPQFWPSSMDLQDKLKDRLREIEALRNLMVWLRYVLRVAGDLQLVTSDEALRIVNTYYAAVRAAARNGVPEAMQVFQILESYHKRPRKPNDNPTQKKLGKHAKAVAEGKRDGEIYMKTESDTVTKGQRIAMDNSYPKGRGVKVKETETVDVSGNTTFDVMASGVGEGK
jgi:hypothetical protein